MHCSILKKEYSSSPPEKPYQNFGFTESEILYFRVTHKRFLDILLDQKSKIHTVIESGNTFGDFLFVTVNRESNGRQLMVTFYGLGFHEYRDRWFIYEWHWYQSFSNSESCEGEINKDEAVKQVEARKDEISPYAEKTKQPEAGYMFEMLADLTEDDGAIADFDDNLDFLG
jgi:hypothetical protein